MGIEIKKLILIFACGILLLMLCACENSSDILSDDPSEQKNSIVLSSSDVLSTSDTVEEPVQEPATTVDITMTVGDVVITATLDSSDTTREFISSLPRTLTMNRYGDREYYGRIEAISENGETIADFENGDVTYYPAGPSFAVFFDGEERSDQGGLIRMGKVTSDLSVFDTLGGYVEMQIALVGS